jgi:hypothetical protein
VPPAKTGWSLTIDATNAYFATFDGSLYSCPKTGCTSGTLLTSALNSPDGILYDATSNHIFVADTYNNAVEAFTTGGSQVFQDTNQNSPFSLAADANYVYWGHGGGIVRSTRDGQTLTTPASGVTSTIVSVAVDPSTSKLFGATIGETDAGAEMGVIIQTTSASTGSWSYFAGTDTHTQLNINQLIVAGSTVYFIAHGSNAANYANGGVYSCPTSGCTQPATVAAPLAYGTCIMADASNLYFVANGVFYRCALTGCPAGGPIQLATNVYPLQGASCAADATSFYFLEAQGSLLRLAK